MAGPEERGGRVAGGSGEAQAQGQPRDSAMAPMQPSLGPPRDEPRVFGLDKFNGDNFAEWSFKMENIFDHYDLLEVMEGTEKRPENDPEKSPWVRRSAQGYLLLGQALGSSEIRHIKPFQREPEKGPKAWAALKGVHAPATAAVAVVLERQMAALRIEEDEAVEEGVQKFFDLLTRLEGADLNYSELQKKTMLLALLPQSWSSLIINLNRDLPHLSLEHVKRAILQEDFRRRELASADGAGAASISRGYGRGRGRGQGGSRFGSHNFNGGRGSGGYGGDNKSYGRGRGRFDGECHYCHKSGHMWRDCFKLPDGWTPAQGQEGRGAGGGRGRGRGGRGGRGGGAASMKSTGNESESRDDRFPDQFFFVSTQASAGPEKDEGFEEPAAVGKVTLHSLDYWVIDSGATYSMTPRADLLTELEPSPVKHVTSALGQRAEVKGMGKAMFKGADGKMVGLKNPLSPQELREWFARRWRRAAGAGGSSVAEGAAVAGPGGARTVRPGAAGPAGSTGAGAAEGVGTETTAGGPAGGTPAAAGGFGAAGGAAGEGAPAGGTGAVPAVSGVAAQPRPYFVPLREQILGSLPSPGLPLSLACPEPVPSQLQLQPTSPLPAPSPYTGPTGGLAERREPASRPVSPVRAARTSGRGSRQRPPPVPGTHRMSLRPSTAPLRAPLPCPPESSLPALADSESDSLRAASPTVARLLATVVTDPSFESTAASALVTELVDFAARCRLDYATSLVAESESVCPPSIGGACALGTDVLEDRQEEFQCLAAASPHLVSVLLTPEGDPDALDIPIPRTYAEAIEGPYSSQWQAATDAEMASWKSTSTYVDAVPPPGANIVNGMWIFRVKRPPGSPPVFKARYVARSFSQQQGVDYF
ncbi:unnamed protein product [Closterium sp. NIES-53]